MDDNNWIGIACCATFVAHDDPSILDDKNWRWHIWCGFRKKGSGAKYSAVPIDLRKDLVTIKTDHMLVKFFSREKFIEAYARYSQKGACNRDGIEMEISIIPQGLHLEVKSCGYRWVFKEDLEQLIPTMMQSGNSSVWKRKFLAIDYESQP